MGGLGPEFYCSRWDWPRPMYLKSRIGLGPTWTMNTNDIGHCLRGKFPPGDVPAVRDVKLGGFQTFVTISIGSEICP